MSRSNNSNNRSKKQRRNEVLQETELYERQYHTPPAKVRPKSIEAKTDKQQKYINSIRDKVITFGVGPAGTGKTYIAASIAADMLESKEIERIIITRPAVEAGESLGFLPGDESEKYAPYIAPFLDVLNERLGKGKVEYLLKTGKISAEPFAYMRGKTFKDAFVILDEAQNATKTQMKLFLTRIGENSRVVIDGDVEQADIRDSGLADAVNRLSYIPSVGVVKFGDGDIVRSGIVAEIIQAYRQEPLGKAILG
ncbi:PhoH family protein [Methylobacillus sp.]|uniref:PhoH family protein n=1 Tax=Methylobacillus sp. TaxID=56818 RepID=UPI0012BDBBB9|nr:PhoH family protein [Methylobacillus sp.]MPS48565.1 phosphate starvation-inducible protein PhoH [Methylobacillus sp.]